MHNQTNVTKCQVSAITVNTIRHASVITHYSLSTLTTFTLLFVACRLNAGELPENKNVEISEFITSHCSDCHDSVTREGGLNLTNLEFSLQNKSNRNSWVKIFDRIVQGEMPPPDSGLEIASVERKNLIGLLGQALHSVDHKEVAAQGRGPLRRLTRNEFEYNLRDLFQLPHLDVKSILPEDRTSHGYTKLSDSLDMSRVQLNAYMDAAEYSLKKAIASGVTPPSFSSYRAIGLDLFPSSNTFGNREAMFFAKNDKMVSLTQQEYQARLKSGERDPEVEVAIFRSATWPYYGYPRGFVAHEDGIYRVRFSARAVRQVRDFRLVPALKPQAMTFRARKPSGPDVSGDVRSTGGWIDILPEKSVFETEILLKKGETFEYSILGLAQPFVIAPKNGPIYYNFPPMPAEGHPGVAFQWLEVSGPIQESDWPPASHQILFDDLPIQLSLTGSQFPIEVVTKQPAIDAEYLFRRFVRLSARQPVPEKSIATYLELINSRLKEGASFTESMMAGYQAFLCSGHFLYLQEPIGRKQQANYAVASRLSHFLWNSRPDEQLLNMAHQGKIFDPEVLRSEFDRMIAKDKFERFVINFTDSWLDLKELHRDLPDIRLYPEYRKDDYLVDSMGEETRAFFRAMVRSNLPSRVVIDTDFAFVNDRLAQHYCLSHVEGSYMRRVKLPKRSPHGGLLSQASIMKITANGTATSPVLRGVWVMEKLIGVPPPPPPPAVPAIEPDIRGASTVRELLAKHTESETCSGCHSRFDPVGFALENYDIMGAWRDHYRGLEEGELITGIDRAGHSYEYRVGNTVDPSGKLRTGETFRDIHELKQLLISNQRQLAKNLLEQFVIYATGTPVRFSDRTVVQEILDRCGPNGYCVRDLLSELVLSEIFLGHAEGESLSAR
ncbi:DUF1592 domain-containing protein [Calycomorphotria hydatis]|uniref:DUF1592 domain-containing protein n=1 Tax=Calycomorphotria hydatis TaxID=2528027 RepID=UPI0018D25E51|nr:DUF1592 domain-containing protein [Calycomorphotria hydatis]